MNIIDLAIRYAWTFLGRWYKWGGDDPSGFDCSGLACELLQAVGKIPPKSDYNAVGLSGMFPKVDLPKAGCLAFWCSGGNQRSNIAHVEFCIDEKHTIGASGGGSATITERDAVKQNAFIKIRPIDRARVLWGYVDPFLNDR